MHPIPDSVEDSRHLSDGKLSLRRCLPGRKRNPLQRRELGSMAKGRRHGQTGPLSPPIAAADSCHIHSWIFSNPRASAASCPLPPPCRPFACMPCCKCCCGNKDCSAGERGKCCCGGVNGTCCETNEICCNGACTSTPTCSASGSGSFSLAPCETYSGFAYLIINTCCCTATLTLTGSANDDVLIDGSIYEDGQYPYNWPSVGDPCGRGASANGSHSFTYTKSMAPGASIRIGGRDNGFGGGVSWSYSFACNPLP